ncbi:hypothetical protein, partial [Bradyrhizobium genosp. SA-3]|uniref:hypothetical protein n=1 Tax=Bradyrhizobium genosp. SA-3 TaxID=508868 RepID=UPI001ABF483B
PWQSQQRTPEPFRGVGAIAKMAWWIGARGVSAKRPRSPVDAAKCQSATAQGATLLIIRRQGSREMAMPHLSWSRTPPCSIESDSMKGWHFVRAFEATQTLPSNRRGLIVRLIAANVDFYS